MCDVSEEEQECEVLIEKGKQCSIEHTRSRSRQKQVGKKEGKRRAQKDKRCVHVVHQKKLCCMRRVMQKYLPRRKQQESRKEEREKLMDITYKPLIL
eukprot:14914254-Ditylum_brightwellii.AAC.1